MMQLNVECERWGGVKNSSQANVSLVLNANGRQRNLEVYNFSVILFCYDVLQLL